MGILAAMAVSIAMDVLRPWPMKILVDHIVGHQPLPAGLATVWFLRQPRDVDILLLFVVVSGVAIYLGGALASMVETVVSVRLGQRLMYNLAADLFLHVQRLSLAFHRRRPVGDTISRVTIDPYCIQALLNQALQPVLRSTITLLAMFTIMWRLDHTLTLLTLLVVPLLVAAIRLCGETMRLRHKQRRDLEGGLMAIVEHALGAIPAVQAFAREELERARFRAHADHTAAAYLRAIRADVRFNLFVGLATAAGTAAIMWVGARDVLHGRATLGTLLVFLSYVVALYTPLQTGVSTIATVQSAAASADRIAEIFAKMPDVRDGPHDWARRPHGDVTYDDVTFGYETGRPTVSNVSFHVRAGERVALVGPTGAGKTTVLSLLVRFFDPWSGRIAIDGHDIRQLRVKALRDEVAVVLQDAFVMRGTIAENIAYSRPEATPRQIIEAAQAAGADDFIRRLPDGYDTLVGEHGATLSGGEKQQLAIARAFLKDAPILILDEPTASIDSLAEARVLEALERLAQRRTTFIIAHRFSTIQRADRILVLAGGRIVEDGKPGALLAQEGLYATLARGGAPTELQAASGSCAPTIAGVSET